MSRKLTGPLRALVAIGNSNLDPEVRDLLRAMLLWTNYKTWVCDPGIESIARSMGRAPNTVRGWRDKAVGAGAVSVLRGSKGGHRQTKQYRLEIKAIEGMNPSPDEEKNPAGDEGLTPRLTNDNPSPDEVETPQLAHKNPSPAEEEQTREQTNEQTSSNSAGFAGWSAADAAVRDALRDAGFSEPESETYARLEHVTPIRTRFFMQEAKRGHIDNGPGFLRSMLKKPEEPGGLEEYQERHEQRVDAWARTLGKALGMMPTPQGDKYEIPDDVRPALEAAKEAGWPTLPAIVEAGVLSTDDFEDGRDQTKRDRDLPAQIQNAAEAAGRGERVRRPGWLLVACHPARWT